MLDQKSDAKSPSENSRPPDYYATSGGKSFLLREVTHVSASPECSFAIVGGVNVPMDESDARKLGETWQRWLEWTDAPSERVESTKRAEANADKTRFDWMWDAFEAAGFSSEEMVAIGNVMQRADEKFGTEESERPNPRVARFIVELVNEHFPLEDLRAIVRPKELGRPRCYEHEGADPIEKYGWQIAQILAAQIEGKPHQNDVERGEKGVEGSEEPKAK